MSGTSSAVPGPSEAVVTLLERLETGEVRVGILGLGYVGLPLAMAFAEAGVEVLGFDVDERKVAALEAGESYIGAVDDTVLRRHSQAGRFRPTSSFDALPECDAVLICVPTPLVEGPSPDGEEGREPDLSYVVATAEKIRDHLRAGQLVVLESTTYPGTTDEVIRPLLEQSGLSCGTDFLLAFSPEREDPGNPDFRTTDIPKVVGGVDGRSTEAAAALYERVVPKVVRVSSAAVAEACKLTENIFRAVNIALVNELKVIYQALGLDVHEVLDAAETKPFGFMRFHPGPGWGGHCIPVDPYYLSWKAEQAGVRARFIELAGLVNVEMPRYVVDRLRDALSARGLDLRGSRVLVLGLAYKKNVADPRESPAFEILDLLREEGAELGYHDPYFPEAPRMRNWPDLPELSSQPLTEDTLRRVDAVLLVTDHDAVDYELVLEAAPLIVDTRACLRKVSRTGRDETSGGVDVAGADEKVVPA